MIQFTGVANAMTASTLQTNNFTHGIFQKMQNGFNQKRSGDIILNLEPGWIEKDGNITNHNSAYTYDTHVPLIWFGWRINRSSISRPVDLIDIAPTITNLLNISAPNGCSGKPILELIE
ncbi:Calcium-transporting ATPase [subsurface metagenome]